MADGNEPRTDCFAAADEAYVTIVTTTVTYGDALFLSAFADAASSGNVADLRVLVGNAYFRRLWAPRTEAERQLVAAYLAERVAADGNACHGTVRRLADHFGVDRERGKMLCRLGRRRAARSVGGARHA